MRRGAPDVAATDGAELIGAAPGVAVGTGVEFAGLDVGSAVGDGGWVAVGLAAAAVGVGVGVGVLMIGGVRLGTGAAADGEANAPEGAVVGCGCDALVTTVAAGVPAGVFWTCARAASGAAKDSSTAMIARNSIKFGGPFPGEASPFQPGKGGSDSSRRSPSASTRPPIAHPTNTTKNRRGGQVLPHTVA